MSFLPFSRPSLGEEEMDAVKAVFDSGWITTGAVGSALEQDFCRLTGNHYAVAVSSATAAMHLCLMALDIGPGDEVITPSMTWVSTLNMISLLGATPVMIDCDRETLMVTPQQVAAAITDQTRAIIPVHYAGAAVDLAGIRAVAERYAIPVIEDAAHALGTLYQQQPVGRCGTAIFSLHAIKNVTCGEGGVLVTDNAQLAERVRALRFHGLGVDAFDRQTQGRKPQAEVLSPGFKYNLPDINAAIARVQLTKLEQFIDRRRQIASHYLAELPETGLQPLAVPHWSHQHSWHLFIVRVDSQRCAMQRDTFMTRLAQQQIGSGLHFRAAHTHAYYRQRSTLSLPNSEWNSERICSLPLFPGMTDSHVCQVIQTIKQVIGGGCDS